MCPMAEQNKMANFIWVASHLLDDFRSNPNMDVKCMQDTIMRRYGVLIPNHICCTTRRFMKESVEGKDDEGYGVLSLYIEKFKERNSESVCFINWTNQGPSKNPTFKRCMICIGSALSAFKEHCRPLNGIDACFLKGPYKGVLMTAMGLDGNNGQFPLAYGVAPCENEEEWSFFIHGLDVALEAREDSFKHTIISDRHKVTHQLLNILQSLYVSCTCMLI